MTSPSNLQACAFQFAGVKKNFARVCFSICTCEKKICTCEKKFFRRAKFNIALIAASLSMRCFNSIHSMPENLILETTQGSIELKLFDTVAPKTCKNFRTHAGNGYYDGIIFHRIIEDFMIQGGDPTGTGRGGESIWGKPFEDECSPDLSFHKPGLLAMANAGPATNGSQFFITIKSTPWLNMKHTIFGEVRKGMDVVKALEKVETDDNDRPLEDQKIISIQPAE